MSISSRSNNFIEFCLANGYSSVVQKDLERRRKSERRIATWKRDNFAPNHVNDKRKYYRGEYLKSEHWKSLKADKLSRVFACEHCGSNKCLDVHHLNYRNLYDVTLYDLKVLCRKCHRKEHAQ